MTKQGEIPGIDPGMGEGVTMGALDQYIVQQETAPGKWEDCPLDVGLFDNEPDAVEQAKGMVGDGKIYRVVHRIGTMPDVIVWE